MKWQAARCFYLVLTVACKVSNGFKWAFFPVAVNLCCFWAFLPQISLKKGGNYFKSVLAWALFQEEFSTGFIYTKGKQTPNLKPAIVISFIVVVANNYACIGLDKIEERLPILNQPTDKCEANSTGITSLKCFELKAAWKSYFVLSCTYVFRT